MRRKGWLLFLALLCVAFLISCARRDTSEIPEGDLIRKENNLEGGSTKYKTICMASFDPDIIIV